jgi:hypothetical protein
MDIVCTKVRATGTRIMIHNTWWVCICKMTALYCDMDGATGGGGRVNSMDSRGDVTSASHRCVITTVNSLSRQRWRGNRALTLLQVNSPPPPPTRWRGGASHCDITGNRQWYKRPANQSAISLVCDQEWYSVNQKPPKTVVTSEWIVNSERITCDSAR